MHSAQTNPESVINLNALIAKVKDLPPLPTIITKALETAMDPDASIRNLHLLISQDQALSAKILRIVNSAMYSLRSEVSTVSHAIAVLGINTVKAIIMAASVDHVFQSSSKDLGTKLMTEHSWGTALAARAIARHVRYENSEEALICGLMHDIGKPVMMQNLRDQYQEIIREVYEGKSAFHLLELQAFGFSHAHVGAMLARKWNFPPQLSEAVGYHHDPMAAPKHRKLACIVNLANLVMVSMGIGFEKNRALEPEKLYSAEQLNLGKPALEALISELGVTIRATTYFGG